MSPSLRPAVVILCSLLSGVLPVTAAGQPAAAGWTVDSGRSSIQFTVTKLGFSDVAGRFNDFTATVTYDRARPERSSVGWEVRMKSVQTDSADRDRSLLAPEYFDAQRHPVMTFRSTAVRRLEDGRLEVDGTLTIKGHAEAMTVVVQPIDGGFETRFDVDRLRFDVRGGTVMRLLIGRMVRVHVVLRGA